MTSRNLTRTRRQHPEAPPDAKICSHCGQVNHGADYYCGPCRAGYMRSYRLSPESFSRETNLLHDPETRATAATLANFGGEHA